MRWQTVCSVFCAVLLAGAAARGQEETSAEFVPNYLFTGLSGGIWMVGFTGLNEALEAAGYPALPGFSGVYGQQSVAGLREGPRLGFRVLYGSAQSRVEERISNLNLTLGSGSIEWHQTKRP